jgi:hypothetical protein
VSRRYEATRSFAPLNEDDDYEWQDQQADPDPIGYVWTKEVGVVTGEAEDTNQRTIEGPAGVAY